MKFELLIIFFFITILFTINFFLKKFNISLDKASTSENHKALLRSDSFTPISGTYYFLPIILILFYQLDFIIIIFCSLFFLLGLMSDLKIITSYKSRLIVQFLFLSLLFFISKDIIIDTRIDFIDNLMQHNLARIIICTFFFMVLINGFNLIDGVNCLCGLNFLIISFFIYLLVQNENIDFIYYELNIFILSLLIFLLFNFFGKNFLGDGAAYGISFFLGYILVKVSLTSSMISPYFVANLLWYPAFENLFSILRRNLSNKNNYLPDNDHLHQLIFKYFKNKNFITTNFLLSSFVGIIINLILLIIFSIGYIFYNHTIIQIILILCGIFLYLISYYSLKNKLK